MDNETLRKVQLIQLEMAKEVKRICEENGIKYFLDSGTLLGAVRHKGFIPWDDDLDIGMMQEEYERFLKIAPSKLSSEYFLQTWENDKNYPLPFAKIRKRNTLFIESMFENIDMHHGIWIDIFPYYSCPDDEKEKNKLSLNLRICAAEMLMKCNAKTWISCDTQIKKLWAFIKRIPFIIYAKFHTKKQLISKYKVILKKYSGLNTYRITTPSGKWIIPRKCGEQLEEIIFEGIMFSAPADSDLYLKSVYGDYMVLPPEDKRDNKHNILKIKL